SCSASSDSAGASALAPTGVPYVDPVPRQAHASSVVRQLVEFARSPDRHRDVRVGAPARVIAREREELGFAVLELHEQLKAPPPLDLRLLAARRIHLQYKM